LNWSPGWKDGALAKLTGGPNKTTVSMGWASFTIQSNNWSSSSSVRGLPRISNGVSNPSSVLRLLPRKAPTFPNVSDAFLNLRAITCGLGAYSPDPSFRAISDQTAPPVFGAINPLTIKRRNCRHILLQVGYVALRARLLAIHDQNPANARPALILLRYWDPRTAAGPSSEDNQYHSISQPGQTFIAHIGGPTPEARISPTVRSWARPLRAPSRFRWGATTRLF